MSEFTEKLRSSELVWNAVNEVDKDQADVGFLIEIIRNEFKDWQPPKPREIPVEIPVEIPQFVAGWFEEKMSVAFSEVVSAYSFSGNEAIAWVYENGGIDLLCKMKLYGYTVEKEKLYLLKHIDISSRDTSINYYLTHTFTSPFIGHTGFSKLCDMSKIKDCHFTQQEIDDMETGSYEQIAVTINEV